MKHTKILLGLLLLFAIAAVAPRSAFAEGIANITKAQGNVEIFKPGMERGIPAREEQPVAEGDILITETNSRAEITFADQSVIRIAPQSKIEITKYLLENGQRKSGVFNLFSGKIRAIVSKSVKVVGASFSDNQNFQVRTPTAVAGVKGTDFFMFHINGVSGIVVNEGLVEAYNISMPGKTVSISAGSGTFIKPNEPPQPPTPAAKIEMMRHTQDTDIPETSGVTPAEAVSYSIVEADCK